MNQDIRNTLAKTTSALQNEVDISKDARSGVLSITEEYFSRHPNPKTTTVYPHLVKLTHAQVSLHSDCSIPQ